MPAFSGPVIPVAALPAWRTPEAALVAGPPPVPPSRADLPLRGLAFEVHDAPEVSVVVATHGGFERVRRCLEALRDDHDAPPFEVLVVEDASGDPEIDRIAHVPGVRYLRNAANLGYLRSMNAAVAQVRAPWLVLLNDDCLPRPGWLRGLLRTFAIFHDCGIAGARLLYPDGRQQETGAVVWNDGSGWNHGHGEASPRVEDGCVREVDYVSAAAAMMSTALWRELGGFDERFAPAYYEDTDLAFRLRARGYRAYYQPAAEVVHEGGASYGTDEAQDGKHHQALNRARFADRWREALDRDQLPPGRHPFLARARAQRRTSVLVVDQSPPRPERDAGSRAIWQLLQHLRRLDLDVRVWSQVPVDDVLAADLLAIHGFELFDQERAGATFEAWYAAHAPYIDHVVLSRAETAAACLGAVRRHGHARVAYYGHDIHHVRIGRQAKVDGDPALDAAAARLRDIERDAWRRADRVLYPTDVETAVVRDWLASEGLPPGRAATAPLYALDAPPAVAVPEPSGRRDVLFVGGFAHAPNGDGIGWFLRDCWPRVRARNPSLRLVVVGAAPPDWLQAAAGDDVVVTGAIDEATLASCYASARVSIAPLRFGAGLKGKVLEALYQGVPCVTTPVGAEGLEDVAALRVAADPDEFADQVAGLAADDAAWSEASRDGRAHVAARFSAAAMQDFWRGVLGTMGYASVADRLEVLDG